eukprot:2202099-Rhodomonas_salina.2
MPTCCVRRDSRHAGCRASRRARKVQTARFSLSRSTSTDLLVGANSGGVELVVPRLLSAQRRQSPDRATDQTSDLMLCQTPDQTLSRISGYPISSSALVGTRHRRANAGCEPVFYQRLGVGGRRKTGLGLWRRKGRRATRRKRVGVRRQ